MLEAGVRQPELVASHIYSEAHLASLSINAALILRDKFYSRSKLFASGLYSTAQLAALGASAHELAVPMCISALALTHTVDVRQLERELVQLALVPLFAKLQRCMNGALDPKPTSADSAGH